MEAKNIYISAYLVSSFFKINLQCLYLLAKIYKKIKIFISAYISYEIYYYLN